MGSLGSSIRIQRFVGSCLPNVVMIRFGKLISEFTECYKPGKSILMMGKSFLKRLLSFNFQEQFNPSRIVTKTSIISLMSENHFILLTSLHRPIASGASAKMLCFPFGGVITV